MTAYLLRQPGGLEGVSRDSCWRKKQGLVTSSARVELAARRSPDRAGRALLRHLVDTRLVGLLGVFAPLPRSRPTFRTFRFGDGLCSQLLAEFSTGKGFRSPPVDWPRARDPHARLASPGVAHRAVHTGDHHRIGAPTHTFPPPAHPSRVSIRSRPRLLNRQPSHSRAEPYRRPVDPEWARERVEMSWGGQRVIAELLREPSGRVPSCDSIYPLMGPHSRSL